MHKMAGGFSPVPPFKTQQLIFKGHHRYFDYSEGRQSQFQHHLDECPLV